MKNLITDSDKIRIGEVEDRNLQQNDFWSDEPLESGDIVFEISINLFGHSEEQIKLNNIQDMRRSLEQFDRDDYSATKRHPISPSGYIEFAPRGEPNYVDMLFDSECPVCEDHVPQDSDVEILVLEDWIGIHVDCIDKLIDILDDVWKHSDEILASQFG